MNSTATIISAPETTALVKKAFWLQLLCTFRALFASETGRLVIQALEFWAKAQVFQFVNQGFWVFGLSGTLPRVLRDWFKRENATLRVNSMDPIYAWVTAWMVGHPEWKCQKEVELSSDKHGRGPASIVSFRFDGKALPDEQPKTSVGNYNPAVGVEYVLSFKRYKVTILRKGNDGTSGKSEKTTYHINIPGANWAVLEEFSKTIKDAYLEQLDGMIPVYQAGVCDFSWTFLKSIPKRSLDTVHLDGDIKEKLVADVERFLNRKSIAEARGTFNHHRGYLLYGPPGTGKTSVIMALAGHFDLKVHILHLSSSNVDDATLGSLMARLDDRSLVLIEDIDKSYPQETTSQGQDSSGGKGVTLGGLLNVLDGLGTAQGQLSFVTTNNKGVLDEAVLRAGRLDCQIELSYATKSMARSLFRKFFSFGTSVTVKETDVLSDAFSEQLREGLSMAQLEGYLWAHDSDPGVAVSRFSKWQKAQIEERCRLR